MGLHIHMGGGMQTHIGGGMQTHTGGGVVLKELTRVPVMPLLSPDNL
jgi:hypothetical protein